MAKEIVLVGYSGHGYVVAEAATQQGLLVKYYTNKEQAVNDPFNLKYLGFEANDDFGFWNKNYGYVLGIGDNYLRRSAADIILKNKKDLITVIHPSSSIADKVEIGMGNFISRNASINPLAKIGDYCILNTSSTIEHECEIADAVHIAPGAVLAGGVSVGDNSFIGANAVVKEGVKIGANVIIGAGSVVIRDVADHEKLVGNPARNI